MYIETQVARFPKPPHWQWQRQRNRKKERHPEKDRYARKAPFSFIESRRKKLNM